MQNIRFIIKGAKAGETANALQAYLQTEWSVDSNLQIDESTVTSSSDGQEKGFDPDSLKVFIELYVGFKLLVDGAAGLLETKEKLEKLAAWAEITFTQDYEVLWLEVNGIPYPVKAENLDDILEAMQDKQNL